MPARGDGLAMLKWISSFPGNPEHGLPTVMGVVILSDATTSAPVALLDARSVTALRTGAVAAVASRALAREDARTAGIIGCGLHGAWAARCLAAAGYGPGVCSDPRAATARALAAELGWEAGDRAAALACDVVCCVTPGAEPVVDVGDLQPRPAPQHARRRRPGQGGGDGRGGHRLLAVLRRMGAGQPRRRADRRRSSRGSSRATW